MQNDETPLSLRDISPFRGENYYIKLIVIKISPERGDFGFADRGVPAEGFSSFLFNPLFYCLINLKTYTGQIFVYIVI